MLSTFPKNLYINVKTLILHLQEIFGYCLTQDVSFEKCFFFWGSGANGKSVLLYALKLILDKLAVSLGLDLLLGQNKFFLSQLQGKTANILTEANTKHTSNEIFKSIVSGETIVADIKFHPSISFNPFAKFVFSSNFLSISKDTSDGFYRRWDVLEFKRKFSYEEQDRLLKDKLKKEVQGIFNWALEGLIRLRKQGHFTESEDFAESFKEFRSVSDPFSEFLNENFEKTKKKDEFIPCSDFRTEYLEFCRKNGYYELADNVIGRLMKTKGYEKTRQTFAGKRQNVYKGLKKI